MVGNYLVKEIFGPTIQGEGAYTGTPCMFLRFVGCNLACTWCDTDFTPQGAVRYTAQQIATKLCTLDIHHSRRVVITGGEPTLQWDHLLAEAIRVKQFVVHMESNGTQNLKAPVDWLTVSPKPHFHQTSHSLTVLDPSECKVVVDDTVNQETLQFYEAFYPDTLRFVQPCMDNNYDHHLQRTIALVTQNPSWRISLQTHKIIGLR